MRMWLLAAGLLLVLALGTGCVIINAEEAKLCKPTAGGPVETCCRFDAGP